jgi:hypothetical protein
MSSVTFDVAVGGDGSTVTDDNNATTGLRDGGWKTRFVPCFTQQVAVANYVVNTALTVLGGATTNSTSTTSLAIGTGSKSLTLVESGKAYIVGQYVVIASTASPSNNMVGQITSFSGTSLVVNVTTINGSGTISAWSISVTAVPSSTSYLPLAGGTMTGALAMTDQILSRAMFKDVGYTYYNSGTTNALDYVNGSHQRWTPNTGAQTLSITNWSPTGNLSELLIEGVNLGAATITFPTINWIKSDGTTTTTFSSNGVTLQTSGTDWLVLWTRDAGTTIYGKVIR